MPEFNPVSDDTRRKAQKEARMVGTKQGQPKEKREIYTRKGTKNAFFRFNSSVVRPISEDPEGLVDIPNPDFFPSSTNQAGVASLPSLSLEEAQERTQILLPPPEPGIPLQLLEEIAQQQIRHDPETGQGLNSVFLNREALT
ncbi:MAG: hypothetical protein ACREHC_04290, partial [Candidatus Levyibacteriota bacterium]